MVGMQDALDSEPQEQAPGASVYVYYHVNPALASQVTQRLGMMRQALAQEWPGLQLTCLQRASLTPSGAVAEATPNAPDGQALWTWMEIYEAPRGIGAACLSVIEELAKQHLHGWIGPRHVEIFRRVTESALQV